MCIIQDMFLTTWKPHWASFPKRFRVLREEKTAQMCKHKFLNIPALLVKEYHMVKHTFSDVLSGIFILLKYIFKMQMRMMRIK